MTITEGRQALAAMISGATGVTYSPAALPSLISVKQLPAAIVRYRRLTNAVIGTGSVYEQGVSYRVQVAVSLLNVETAEAELETATDGIIAALRADPTIGGVAEDMVAGVTTEPAIYDENASGTPLLVGTIDVTLTTEER